MSAPAWLSRQLDDGRILCEACHQHCKLKEGEYGVCGIRRVEEGKLRLLAYGLAAAVNVDPVEKKPMFHFLPGSKVFSFGTVGCNFTCAFCQNYDISQYPKEHGHAVFGKELPPERVIELARENGCRSIAYTYNEPVVFFEYTYDTARLAHEAGLKNIYVTSGFETHRAIDTIAPYLDAMNIDIKGFTETFYNEICGAKLKPVLDTVRYAHKKGIWIEVTTLLITGRNDSDEEIRDIAKFIAELDTAIPWHLSAFYPMYKMLDVPPMPLQTLRRAYEIGKEEGLQYIYIGNIDDEKFESTYCPQCSEAVIRRSGRVGQHVTNRLNENGICPICGYNVEGVWH
jgi:pyruvate formate lyase activating enzyme